MWTNLYNHYERKSATTTKENLQPLRTKIHNQYERNSTTTTNENLTTTNENLQPLRTKIYNHHNRIYTTTRNEYLQPLQTKIYNHHKRKSTATVWFWDPCESNRMPYPQQHTLTLCWSDAGQASKTLAQHQTSTGSTFPRFPRILRHRVN